MSTRCMLVKISVSLTLSGNLEAIAPVNVSHELTRYAREEATSTTPKEPATVERHRVIHHGVRSIRALASDPKK